MNADCVVEASGAGTWRGPVGDWCELAKVRLNVMVLISSATGFVLGAGEGISWGLLVASLAGIGCAAAGAAMLNQHLERRWDALMERTRQRPLPAGRVAPQTAFWTGVALVATGTGILAVCANAVAAALTAVTVGVYLFVYTPMKRWSTWNTVVGAVPGAMPPVLGWASATGRVEAGAWVLFGIVFLWQMPHFLAIAWLWRGDYARAGFRMLPVVRSDGRSTGGWASVAALALAGAGIPALWTGLGGPWFVSGAAAAGLGFFALALRFARRRGEGEAKALFFGSLCYLPLILGWLAAFGRS